jgi:hypothetical protein
VIYPEEELLLKTHISSCYIECHLCIENGMVSIHRFLKLYTALK